MNTMKAVTLCIAMAMAAAVPNSSEYGDKPPKNVADPKAAEPAKVVDDLPCEDEEFEPLPGTSEEPCEEDVYPLPGTGEEPCEEEVNPLPGTGEEPCEEEADPLPGTGEEPCEEEVDPLPGTGEEPCEDDVAPLPAEDDCEDTPLPSTEGPYPAGGNPQPGTGGNPGPSSGYGENPAPKPDPKPAPITVKPEPKPEPVTPKPAPSSSGDYKNPQEANAVVDPKPVEPKPVDPKPAAPAPSDYTQSLPKEPKPIVSGPEPNPASPIEGNLNDIYSSSIGSQISITILAMHLLQ